MCDSVLTIFLLVINSHSPYFLPKHTSNISSPAAPSLSSFSGRLLFWVIPWAEIKTSHMLSKHHTRQPWEQMWRAAFYQTSENPLPRSASACSKLNTANAETLTWGELPPSTQGEYLPKSPSLTNSIEFSTLVQLLRIYLVCFCSHKHR